MGTWVGDRSGAPYRVREVDVHPIFCVVEPVLILPRRRLFDCRRGAQGDNWLASVDIFLDCFPQFFSMHVVDSARRAQCH
eukprot:8855532-Pyramimonas_sp.AAC.1